MPVPQPRKARQQTLTRGDPDERDEREEISLAHLSDKTWNTARTRVTECSKNDASDKMDPRLIDCLGVVPSKGRHKSKSKVQDLSHFKRGRAMNTVWGPCILKAKAQKGWNCDFRDGTAGGWFVAMNDFITSSQPSSSSA
jgi:hypothetical protein